MKNAEDILAVCSKLTNHFRVQPAIITDSADKLLIVGDVHGDLETLDYVKTQKSSYDKVIFVSDFVDRGNKDIEVVERLLEFMADIMLVSNHDGSDDANPHDFLDRLYAAYGKNAYLIDQAYRAAFVHAPVAYYNDRHKLLVLHGGIPLPVNEHGDFRKWKKFAEDRAKSGAAYQIMWNDFSEYRRSFPSRRGSGIYNVGTKDAAAFMKKNKLDMIVRGHDSGKFNTVQKLPNGKKIVTVGSASYYCDSRSRKVYSIPDNEFIEF